MHGAQTLKPIQPEAVESDASLEAGQVVLTLGGSARPEECKVDLVSDSDAHAEKLQHLVEALGFQIGERSTRFVDSDTLYYGGSQTFPRQMLLWSLQRAGLKLVPSVEAPLSTEFLVQIRDPLLIDVPLVERFHVDIVSDDEKAAQRIVAELSRQKFRCLPTQQLSRQDALEAHIELVPGPFRRDRAVGIFSRLLVAVEDLLEELAVDSKRFPIEVNEAKDSSTARIILPLRACLSGAKRAYGGAHPERFNILIRTDSAPVGRSLRSALIDLGFDRVEVQRRPSRRRLRGESEPEPGFAVHWGSAAKEATIANMLREAVEAQMTESEVAGDFVLRCCDSFADSDPDVHIYLPVRAARDGSLLERLTNPSRFDLKLYTENTDHWAEVMAELGKWGFASCRVESSGDAPREISYGAAPPELISRLQTFVREKTGLDLPPNKRWHDGDTDIYFALPPQTVANQPSPDPSPAEVVGETIWPELESVSSVEAVGPFVCIERDHVRVGTIQLPRRKGPRHDLAPKPELFAHFCLDRITAATLEHLATSVLLREPCLLEGETSTSKTSCIAYLAGMLGQPLLRINLNGQTDTGELVGRFLPRAEIDEECAIVRSAQDNEFGLQVESIRVAERTLAHPWRWQDGLVVQALKKGWWILLDEVNLAEPQVLERLNSVLEHEPSLVLTENDNSVLGPGGTPVHPDFRIFATMNPAEYAGRSVLSPAYRDRWRAYRFVPAPGETEYLAMLRFLVEGVQPELRLLGQAYASVESAPIYGALAEAPAVLSFLPALARFHSMLESATGRAGDSQARLGLHRRERYVFTRRGLLSVLEYLGSPAVPPEALNDRRTLQMALQRYYINRVSAAEDRATVVQLLDAVGIGPSTWK